MKKLHMFLWSKLILFLNPARAFFSMVFFRPFLEDLRVGGRLGHFCRTYSLRSIFIIPVEFFIYI
jgi:hypothetical protein